MEVDRDSLTLGPQPKPKHMAQTRVLLPVPLGPITIFRLGPGKNSAAVYVTKLVNLTRTIAPGRCPNGAPEGRLLVETTALIDGCTSSEPSRWLALLDLRMRLLSLGAVEPGVLGREFSSSESSARDRRREGVAMTETSGTYEVEERFAPSKR
jgi:hypothetical protein